MATKAEKNTDGDIEVYGRQNAYDLSIDEFCSRLSQKDKRVELIGAFHHVEVAAGRAKGSEADYQARFEQFVNQPV